MGKIITCLDGSAYADGATSLSAWAHERTGLSISLLHVVRPHSEIQTKTNMTGQIGLGENAALLEKLAKLDEEHGRVELKKGHLILDHAREKLYNKGISSPEVMHQRGSLVEAITNLEAQAELIIMGKRGDDHHTATDHLGSNVERVARAIHKPLLLTTPKAAPIRKILIAYDGSPSANKAVDYVAHSPLFKGLECHLLTVGDSTEEGQQMLSHAKNQLKTVTANFRHENTVETIVSEYIMAKDIDLLVIGAYGHSKIRNLILGSTTTALIQSAAVPVMLFP